MRFFRIVFLTLLLVQLGCQSTDSSESQLVEVIPVDLKTEMLVNPEGIGTKTPRFYWQFRTKTNGIYQEAYQILVADSPDSLTEESANLWNSGKVSSVDNIHIPYEGKLLKSKTKCYWKVKTWTNKGESDWSNPAYFSVGLLHYQDWKGRWIGFDYAFPWEDVQQFPTVAARYFRTEFKAEKKVKSATAYIIGLGLYELEINGKKVGDAVLAPAPTDYTRNVKINSYEVTEMINTGTNALGVKLGNGRYFAMRPVYKPYKVKHFGFPKLLFQLEINYMDGSKEVVYSNDKWKGTADGPIRNNNEYDGELFDARKDFPNWSQVGFEDSSWLQADYVSEPGGDYQSQMNENMRVMEIVKPILITLKEDGRYILDMGQNMVGWIQIRTRGKKDSKLTLRYAESLDENGELFRTNLRDAQAMDTYIFKEDGSIKWEPSFTFHGFRYVEVTGVEGRATANDFVGKMVFDNVKTVGQFETSDQTINQIFKNAWWGIAGNYKGMPIDCPQRNERQPWLGDRPVQSYGESFLFDNSRIYKKWLEDIQLGQKEDGSISDVSPAFWNYYSDNMTWAGTYLMVADMLYNQTGDEQVIKDHYPSMKKWLNYMQDRYQDENYLITKDSYGDWCVPPPTIEEATGKNADVKRPSALISTAYYYYYLALISKFAKVAGADEDISIYQALRPKVREGFNKAFFDGESSYTGTSAMTDNLLALAFDLVPDEKKETVFNRVVDLIENQNNGHLNTGVVGTQWIMRTLTEYGRPDLALKITTNTTYPSWGYMIENGATTIWELWHGNVANPKMNSQNHVMMLGDLLVWYYENLAGIKAAEPGFKKIIMKPEFDVDLKNVNASYQSIHGTITSFWKKEDSDLGWIVNIPANTSAEIYLPTENRGDVYIQSDGESTFLERREGKVVYLLESGVYRIGVSNIAIAD